MLNYLPLWKFLNLFLMRRFERLMPFINFSFSQEGEDLILKRIFENKKNGFYVDIGAHHPIRFSNTFYFYKSGWSGINIDASPGSMRLFDSLRPNDINIEVAIGNKRTPLEYYIFNEPALNSFDRKLSLHRQRTTSYRIVDTKLIQIVPLKEILEKYLPIGRKIDFLTIDVEGLELDVLESNNWDIYSPNLILVEFFSSSLEDILRSDIHNLLTSLGYLFISSTPHTLFYRLEHSSLC